jgi:hypothetical protein
MDESTLIAVIVVLVILLLSCMTGNSLLQGFKGGYADGFEPVSDYSNSGSYYGALKEGLANNMSMQQLTGLHFDGFANLDKRNLALLRNRKSTEGLFSSYSIQPY